MQAEAAQSPNLRSAIYKRQLAQRWAQLLLIAALVLGLGLRLAFVLHGADIGGSPLVLDEGNYVGSAVPLAQGQGIPDRWLWERPPLYILFLAANFALFGKEGTGNLFAVGLVQTLLGLFSIWLVWRITRLLFPLRPLAAGFAALLFAVAPAPVFYANVYMSETLYIALLLVWLYAMLRWQQGERRLVPTDVGVGERSGDTPAPINIRNSSFVTQHLVVAAVAFAGAMLTRSLLLYFLPLLLGWMVWQGRADWRRAVVQATVFAAIVFALIAPWTVRNTLHYGRFILIDTTGQINLYIDNGPLSRADAYARLGSIANLGDRADFAQREGVAAILADPTRFAGAAWARLGGTWRADLFTEFQVFLARKYPSTSGTTELWYALAGGGFHLLFFLLAIIGLAFAQGEGVAKGLVLLLAALYTLTTLVAHPEYRYVIPFFAVFAPWAGGVLAGVLAPRHWRQPSPLTHRPLAGAGSPQSEPVSAPTDTGVREPGGLAPAPTQAANQNAKLKTQNFAVAAIAIGWLLYSSAPVLGGYVSGTRAAYLVLRANVANLLGDVNGEAGQITLALADFDAANLRTRLGDIRRGQGDIASATSLYQQASASDPNYWPAALSWGAARRQQGDIAGAAAAFDKVKAEYRARAQAWAFDHLWDVAAVADVGQADYGYVRGGFEPEREGERTYRWTTANAAVRLYTAAPATTITLTLRASRANQSLRISVNGQQLGDYQPTLEWQSINISLPANLREAHNYTVELATEAQPVSAQDTRALGVAVDVVGVK